MKYKTAFRLGLKLIGVWLVFSGIAEGLMFGAYLVEQLLTSSSLGYAYYWSFGVSALGKLVAGFYLFFGGRWIADRAIPSNRPYCYECGYELSGLASDGLCPECGTTFRRGDPIGGNR